MNIIDSLSDKERHFGSGALIAMYAGSVFAHEYSHLTAMRALFTNINPYIGCSLPFNCFAAWGGNPVVRPELSMTFRTADGIASAAGPISDIIGVSLSSLIAWKTRQSHKKISLLFATHAFITALNTFSYAACTLGSGYSDFAKTESNLGIPHIFQTAIMGSLTLGTTLLAKHILSFNPMETGKTKVN